MVLGHLVKGQMVAAIFMLYFTYILTFECYEFRLKLKLFKKFTNFLILEYNIEHYIPGKILDGFSIRCYHMIKTNYRSGTYCEVVLGVFKAR